MLDVVLDLLFKLVRRLVSLDKHYRCLYDLTAYRVRRGGDGAFENAWVRHQRAFDLKRADAVARALYNVVRAALEPLISLRIAPCGVARVVKVVAERPCIGGVILLIALEKTARIML